MPLPAMEKWPVPKRHTIRAVQAIRSLKNADGKIDLAAYIRWRRGDTPSMTMEDACQKIEEMYRDNPLCTDLVFKRLRADIEKHDIEPLAPEGNGKLTSDELSAAYENDGQSSKSAEALNSKQGPVVSDKNGKNGNHIQKTEAQHGDFDARLVMSLQKRKQRSHEG